MQYGSQKLRTSLGPVAIEIIQQEYSKITHTPYIQVNYDAHGCHDRIIPEIALTISKKYGVHQIFFKLERHYKTQDTVLKLAPLSPSKAMGTHQKRSYLVRIKEVDVQRTYGLSFPRNYFIYTLKTLRELGL